MNWPVLRLVLFFCTALPVQRWVTGAGLLLIAGGLWLMQHAPSRAFTLILLGVALILLVTVLMPLAWLFRLLSTPLAHRFLPRFRLRMLVAAGALMTAPVAIAALFVLATGISEPLPQVVVKPLAVVSALFWLVFFAPASLWAALFYALMVVVVARLPEGAARLLELAAQPLPLGMALLAGWAAFAWWYLRAVRVGPFRTPYPLRMLDGFERRHAGNLPEPVSRATATTVHLLWRARPTRRGLLTMIAFFAILTALLASMVSAAYVPIVIIVMLFAQAGAYRFGLDVASRARTLWLRAAFTRAALYRVAETELWLTALSFIFGPLAAVMAAVWLLAAGPGPVMFALWLYGTGLALLAMYLGLGRIRGFRPFDVVAGVAAVASLGTVAGLVFAGISDPEPLLLMAAGQLMLAVVCRYVGVHRWEHVDFAGLRPVRLSPGMFADLK